MNNTSTRALMAQLELQTSLFHNAVVGINDAESATSPNENLNPIRWVAGHLMNTRLLLLSAITGEEMNRNYVPYFGKGSTNVISSDCPSMEEIVGKWDETAYVLLAALSNATDERLMTAAPFQTSIPDDTLLGFVAYLSYHESFHIGQMSILRKLIGKETMSLKRH